ncbi:cyclase family protein [Morganella morganii]|uniref:cyclase family protein n=1 Tax=Morganella morganii TaxID=582 RepID=UPI0032D9E364
MKIIDISSKIHNKMWSYNPKWKNEIYEFSSTKKSESSTIYEMTLFSHTGTYIETSQHKLSNEIFLDDFQLDSFYCHIKIIIIPIINGKLTLESLIYTLDKTGEKIEPGDSVIICCGWSANYIDLPSFISDSPYFEEELTSYLANMKLNLLGVDIPVIDKQAKPYNAVRKLFENNERLLLVAPLVINLEEIKSSRYILNCIPLKIEKVCASLCRPTLILL